MNKVNKIFEPTDCIPEEMLSKYVSGKMSPAEKHVVEKHLLDCEMCSDAMEGLGLISDPKKISGITADLNQRIQHRAGQKKEGKIIFLRQYRTQFAVAASIIVVIGLVWFFRSNMQMKEMAPATAEKIFADKFEPPPSDISSITPDADQEPSVAAARETQDERSEAGKDKGVSSGESSGAVENAVVSTEDVPAQKSAQMQAIVPAEEKESSYKNAESSAKGNTAEPKPEGRSRDEDAIVVSKDVSMSRSEQANLKEKDKKEESKKPQSAPATSAAGAIAGAGEKSISDNKGGLLKQDAGKITDDRQSKEEKTRAQISEGDVLAYEQKKKSGGKESKKEKAPQKVSGGYYETQTISSAAVPKSQTEVAQPDQQPAMDSVAAFSSVASDVSVQEGAMIKYEKQDYAGAVTGFEQALRINPNDEKALFYSAVSYMSLGQTEKAVAYLNKVLQNKNGEYYDSAQWYLSLAYIKNNDTKKARRNLMELQNNSKSKYQKQADETLKEMNK